MKLFHPEQQLSQLSQAVGTSPEVWKWIASRSAETKNSYAARLMLALVVFNGYELFPGSAMSEHTRGAGSELDLDNCYREGGERQFERKWPASLQKSLTLAHDVNRALIREKARQDRRLDRVERIERRKFWYGLGVAAATAFLTNLPKIWAWVSGVTR